MKTNPCPKCNTSEDVIVVANKPKTGWFVFCCHTDECFDTDISVYEKSEEKAVEKWNKETSD